VSDRPPECGLVPVEIGGGKSGVWCPKCLASTGFTFERVALFLGGTQVVGVQGWCRRCGHWLGDLRGRDYL
jgi:hypothetical protein